MSELAILDTEEVFLEPLSESEARGLVSRIRSFNGRLQHETGLLRQELYKLWIGSGWLTLHYKSMTALLKGEFGESRPELTRQLAAARIEVILSKKGISGNESGTNWYQIKDWKNVVGKTPEFKLRALSTFLGRTIGEETYPDQEEELCEAYKLACEMSEGDPGGRDVRAAVNSLSPPKLPKVKESTERQSNSKPSQANGTLKVRESHPGLNGPALAPKEGEVRGVGNWEAFLRSLNNQSLWVRENGGIPGYTQGWTERQIVCFRENLKRFSEEFSTWAAQLEGISS